MEGVKAASWSSQNQSARLCPANFTIWLKFPRNGWVRYLKQVRPNISRKLKRMRCKKNSVGIKIDVNPSSDERWRNLWPDSLLLGQQVLASIKQKHASASFSGNTRLILAKPIIIHFAREISADVISLWEISRRSSEKSAADRNASALGPGWPSDPRLNPNPMSGWIDWLVLGKKAKPSDNYGVVCSAATHSHLHLQGKAIKVFPYIERGR